MVIKGSLSFLFFLIASIASAASNQVLTYQGVLTDASDVPYTTTQSVSFLIYSPAPASCLLYSEDQDVTPDANGRFSVQVGTGTRTDGLAHAFNKVFMNGGSLSGLVCGNGDTVFTPGSTDNRSLAIKVGGVTLSPMVSVNAVPFAMQAQEISGWGINNLVKVSSTGSPTTFTTAEMAVIKGISAAACSNAQILKWNGSTWDCATDDLGAAPGNAGYDAAKGLVSFDTDAATSGITVSSGVAKLSNTGVIANTYGSATAVPTVGINAQGRITSASATSIALPASQLTQSGATPGQVLKWNGLAWVASVDDNGSAPADSSYGAKGIVQFLTDAATSGINVVAGVANVNTGTGPNKIVKLDASSKLPAVDGSALTNLNAGNISSGTLQVDRGGTGVVAYTPNALVMTNGLGTALGSITCALNEIMKWNGSTWYCAVDATGGLPGDASFAAKGLVQGDTDVATSGLTFTAGVIKVNAGTGANQVVKLDGTAKLPAVDGSALTNVTASNFTGVLPIANGGTNSSTALNNNRMMVSSAGKIVEAAAMNDGQIVVGDTGGAPTVATLGSSNGISITPGAGTLSIATNATDANTASAIVSRNASGNFAAGAITNTSNILKGATSGTLTVTVPATVTDYTIKWPSAVGGAGSILTSDASGNLSWGSPAAVADASYVAKGAVQGLTDAATSGLNFSSGVISVNSGAAANQIVKLDGSAKLPGVDASLLTNLNASGVTSGILPVTFGGTGLSTYAAGDLIYASAPSVISQIAIGSVGTMLTSNGSVPTWSGTGNLSTSLTVPVLYGSSTANGDLTLESTSHPTKGDIFLAPSGGKVGIGTVTPSSRLNVVETFNLNDSNEHIASSTDVNVTVPTSGSATFIGNSNLIQTVGSGANNLNVVAGSNSEVLHGGSGSITQAYGSTHYLSNDNMGTLSNATGSNIGVYNTSGGAIANAVGINSSIQNISTGPMTNAYGGKFEVRRSGAGAIATAVGASFEVLNSSVGTLSTAVGIQAQISNSGGSITDGYGLKIGNIQATNNKWSIYASDSSAKTFLAGNVGIGTADPQSILEINGAFTQNEMVAPSFSPADKGRIYFDSTAKKFKVSENGGAYVDLLGGSGSVTLVTSANSDISVADGAAAPVLTLNSGTASNQIVKLDGTAKLPAVDGSALTNLNAANISSGVLPIARGGTGLTTGISGGIPYFDSISTMASSAVLTANGVVLGGGAGAAPVATAAGAADSVLRVPSGGGSPVFGAIDLSKAAAVTGALAVSNGGTGATSFTSNHLVGTNGVGGVLQPVTCAQNQVISFDASGYYGCYNVSSLITSFVDDGNTFAATATLGTNSNHDLAFETNGTTKMTISKTGEVGIGTALPGSKLHVVGDGQTIFMEPANTTNRTSIYMQNFGNSSVFGVDSSAGGTVLLGSAPYATVIGNQSAQAFQIGTSNNIRMTVTSTGNVGIGTANPQSILEINGAFTQNGIVAPAVSPTNKGRIYFDSSANKFKVSENSGPYVDLLGGSFINGGNSFGANSSLGNVDNFNLSFKTNNISRMTIDSTGKIVVGETTPQTNTNLDVTKLGGGAGAVVGITSYSTTATNSPTLSFRKSNKDTEGKLATVSGHILGTVDFQGANGSAWLPGASIQSKQTDVNGLFTAPTELTFWTSDGIGTNLKQRLTVDQSGNVGIGTGAIGLTNRLDVRSDPTDFLAPLRIQNTNTAGYSAIDFFNSSNLNVLSIGYGNPTAGGFANEAYVGTTGANPFILRTLATERMRIQANGNVGIGTTAPLATLDIEGFIKLKRYGAAPVTCAVGAAGTIALTTQYMTCVCNGASWVRTSDGTTPCIW